MTRLDELWIEIWDTVYADAVAVSQFEETYQGLKYPMDKYPCAMVSAGKIEPVVRPSVDTIYELTMPVFIFAKDNNITTGMKEAIEYAGRLQEKLVTDDSGDPLRSLGLAYVENVEAILDSNAPNLPVGYERQAVEVTVVVRFYASQR